MKKIRTYIVSTVNVERQMSCVFILHAFGLAGEFKGTIELMFGVLEEVPQLQMHAKSIHMILTSLQS